MNIDSNILSADAISIDSNLRLQSLQSFSAQLPAQDVCLRISIILLLTYNTDLSCLSVSTILHLELLSIRDIVIQLVSSLEVLLRDVQLRVNKSLDLRPCSRQLFFLAVVIDVTCEGHRSCSELRDSLLRSSDLDLDVTPSIYLITGSLINNLSNDDRLTAYRSVVGNGVLDGLAVSGDVTRISDSLTILSLELDVSGLAGLVISRSVVYRSEDDLQTESLQLCSRECALTVVSSYMYLSDRVEIQMAVVSYIMCDVGGCSCHAAPCCEQVVQTRLALCAGCGSDDGVVSTVVSNNHACEGLSLNCCIVRCDSRVTTRDLQCCNWQFIFFQITDSSEISLERNSQHTILIVLFQNIGCQFCVNRADQVFTCTTQDSRSQRIEVCLAANEVDRSRAHVVAGDAVARKQVSILANFCEVLVVACCAVCTLICRNQSSLDTLCEVVGDEGQRSKSVLDEHGQHVDLCAELIHLLVQVLHLLLQIGERRTWAGKSVDFVLQCLDLFLQCCNVALVSLSCETLSQSLLQVIQSCLLQFDVSVSSLLSSLQVVQACAQGVEFAVDTVDLSFNFLDLGIVVTLAHLTVDQCCQVVDSLLQSISGSQFSHLCLQITQITLRCKVGMGSSSV